MILRSPHFWLGSLSSAGVLYLVAGSLERASPGELAAVHGRVAELSARSGCAECHGEGDVTLAQACLECHEDVGSHVGAGKGLHGALERSVATQCALCHSEHHGAAFPMVNRRAFFIAGVPDPDEFPHEMVGFAMGGEHLELDCTECHEHAHDAVLQEGDRRFLGLAQDCATCHDDPHGGRMARSCAECHGQESFGDLAQFEHDDAFPLVGGHAGPSCADCHEPDGPYAVEVLAGSGAQPRWRSCSDCHDSPHAEAFVEGVARLVAAATGESCGACHAAEHASFRADAVGVSPEHHAASGFALDAPHDAADCADCHLPGAQDFAARYPGRGADECRHCHDDPHGGQFDAIAEGPFALGCVACHERHRFTPHAFTTDLHALTALPLTGRHLEVDCEACHTVPEPGAPRLFHGTASACDGCHPDAHAGFFEPRAAELSAARGGTCGTCHLATSFSDLPAGGFDHGRWTGFELAGAHVQSACESCHPRASEPDSHGRTFGRVTEHFGEVAGCASCHDDPHGGAFDGDGTPREIDGRTGCARCHVETSFRSFPHGFDHGRWTGFALDGAHASASCAACHPPLLLDRVADRARQAGDRTFGRAKGTSCSDCHRDPHAGQFREGGRTDCRSCHEDTSSFSVLAFDHDRDSRFPLDDAHASLACSACHRPWALGAGAETVRYKPLGTECADCHGDREVGLRGRKRKGR